METASSRILDVTTIIRLFRNMAPMGAQPSSEPLAVLGVRDRVTPTLIRPWPPVEVGRKMGSGWREPLALG